LTVDPLAFSGRNSRRSPFANIKQPTLPLTGWAESRSKGAQQQSLPASTTDASAVVPASGSSSAPATDVVPWTDAEFLTLFPHLRTEAEQLLASQTAAAGADGQIHQQLDLASAVAQVVGEVRARHPELAGLHWQSTWLKVRKWRELLGATRIDMPTDIKPQTSGDADASAAASPSDAVVPAEGESADAPRPAAPRNALHAKYFQSDLFFTADQVSSMLLKQRDLLYLNIERTVVPRLSVLRSHLHGVNLTALLRRNPALLLSDLAQSLPLKLRELRALFPEVNVVSLVEKEGTLLSRDAASFLVPRLNLFARISGYAPRHALHFLAVENPHVLSMRWNRLKRWEVVRDQRFWDWWKQQPEAQIDMPEEVAAPKAEGESAAESASTPAAVVNDPASLPSSVYLDLVSLTGEEFAARFPWFDVGATYSPLEKELLSSKATGAAKADVLAKQ